MDVKSENIIQLIEKQKNKLNDPAFDLELWKVTSLHLMDRIYGKGSEKAAFIKQLKIDFSSWSLRDSSGKNTGIEACKKQALEILNSTIDEITILGIPEKPVSNLLGLIDKITVAVESELNHKQIDEIQEILKSEASKSDIQLRLEGKFKEFGNQVVPALLSRLLQIKEIANAI